MIKTGAVRQAAWLLPVLFAVGACSELPRIAGAPLPTAKDDAAPMYRDLADIPEPPAITAQKDNETTIQALSEDRANTAQAAEDLRRQPFDQPDPSKIPGF